jgi:hypothetical protein
MLNKNIVLKQQMARRQILALAILGGGMLVFFCSIDDDVALGLALSRQ